jgi:uncharacterized coiled-coil DUF342 family protein
MVIFKNLVAGSQQPEIMTTALDLTKTAATFASDTRAIEPLLRQIQMISSRLRSDGLLTPEEENSIFDIYFKLEHYLTTADPIRKFNKEDLRNKASKSLRARLEAYEQKVATEPKKDGVA